MNVKDPARFSAPACSARWTTKAVPQNSIEWEKPMKKQVEQAIGSIPALDLKLREQAQKRLDSLTKPRGSLGRLEEFARDYVVMRGEMSARVREKAVIVFASDHGVVEDGVSAYPKDVTHQMVLNFLAGGAAINVISKHTGARVYVVDIGVDHDFGDVQGLVHAKISRGTRNMAVGPAMDRQEALAAMQEGYAFAQKLADEGVDLMAPGDMGIGNTTASSAIAAVFTGKPVADVTGRGTGIDDDTHTHKVAVIERAIQVNHPDPKDPLGVLSKVGGLEIAGIAGLIIGAAFRRIPVVLDGFISTAGGLVAYEMDNRVRDYLFAAHRSVEIGHAAMLERLELAPFVDLFMRLGEGTGASIGMDLIQLGVEIFHDMATFESAGISDKDD